MARIEILDGVSDLDTIYISDEELSGLLGEVGADLGSKDRKKKARGNRRFKRVQTARKKPGGATIEVRPEETANLTSKAKFERRLNRIDKGIRQELIDGNLTTSDFLVYVIKSVTGTTIEMFRAGDNELEGVSNINDAKLPNNATMLVDSLQLLSGVGAGATVEDGKIVDFGKLDPIIANGNYTFKTGQKTLQENTSCMAFKHEGTANLLPGELKLENPVILQKDNKIVFDIDTPPNVPANTFVMLVMRGVMTVKS